MVNPTLSPARSHILFGCALAGTAFLSAALAASDTTEAPPYQLGQGLYLPEESLRVGGYADTRYSALDHQAGSFTVEDLSLFLTKDFGTRWKLFNETEVGDALDVVGHHASAADANIDIERLYVDYFANTVATIRVGEFLTPVGQWNLVHADPLVWTTLRPMTTTAAFAKHATGAMIYGTVNVGNHDLDYRLYVDDTQALGLGMTHHLAYESYGAYSPPSTLTNDFVHAAGGQVVYHMLDDRLSLGASFLSYELKDPQQQYRLGGLDFDWLGPNIELSGESVYRSATGPQLPAEYGGYLQAVVPLPSQVYLVGRYEHYRNALPNETAAIRTIGINYRPLPGLVWKFERDDGDHNYVWVPHGWLASFGVLF